MKIRKIMSLVMLAASSTILMACDDIDDIGSTATSTPAGQIQDENVNTPNTPNTPNNQIPQDTNNPSKENNENQLPSDNRTTLEEITETNKGENIDNKPFEDKNDQKEENITTDNKIENPSEEDNKSTITPNDNISSSKEDSVTSSDTPSEILPPAEDLKGEDGSDGIRTWNYEEQLSKDTFNAINNYRKENGVPELKWSNVEWERANKWALMNVQKQDADHDFEQVSIMTGFDSTADAFLSRWKHSASHNKSILRANEQEGAVAVYRDSNNVYYVVASYTDNWGKDKDVVEIPFEFY